MAVFFSGVSVVFALIAAGLWLKASTIEVLRGSPLSHGGFMNGEVDVFSTAFEQSRWNKYAAILTALATVCQAATVLAQAWTK